jgi:hypothetical protein
MRTKGMVVKVKDSYCIVLTKDGTYHKVPKSRVTNARAGYEIEFSAFNWTTFIRPALLVASILALFMGISLYKTTLPSATAYVSLDINPSIELGIDDNMKVVEVRALNPDAKKVLAGLNVKGFDLYTGIAAILSNAEKKGYLKPDKKNYVLSTITPVKTQEKPINYDKFTNNLKNVVEKKNLDVEILVLNSDLKTHDEAKGKGMSTGKLMVYKDAVDSGDKVSLEEVKQNGLAKLVDNYKVHLLPKNKKLIITSIHIPSRRGDKSSEKDEEEQKDTQIKNQNEESDDSEDTQSNDVDENAISDKSDKKQFLKDSTLHQNSKNNIKDKDSESVNNITTEQEIDKEDKIHDDKKLPIKDTLKEKYTKRKINRRNYEVQEPEQKNHDEENKNNNQNDDKENND